MSRVTDLRREVKRRLSESGVTDLGGYKLKFIDLDVVDYSKVERAFARAMSKVGKGIICEMNKDISTKEQVDKLNEMYKDRQLSLKLEITENGGVKKLIKSLNGSPIEETSIIATLKLGEEEEICYSSIGYSPTYSKQNIWKFRNWSDYKENGYMPFIDFERLIGTVHFFNGIKDYFNKNEEMGKILLAKYIDKKGFYLSQEQYDEVQYFLKKEGYMSFGEYYSHVRADNQKYLHWNDPSDYFNKLEEIFYYSDNSKCYNFAMIQNIGLVAQIFNTIYFLNKEVENDVKTDINNATDYARSYETKKNIPKKVLARMEDNKFKRHFGYVEFDEMVDLEKVSLIEKEWEEINKKIIFPLAKDHSLRFRRLGNHKASGLYFPTMKAVCVDIQGPSSMIHEVLHMIDYTSLSNTTLSSTYGFRSIVERYRVITDEKVKSLSEQNSFKKAWEGKSKYNKDYYQSSREIFARCGELYIEKVLNIESSLVKSDDNILYPVHDKFLLELIEKYYSKVIQMAPDKKEEPIRVVASKTPSRDEIVQILNNNQISLFDFEGVM